jgi:methylmalonyl-CoA mutase
LFPAETIVGVNKYMLDVPESIEVLSIDNSAVRAEQVAKINQLRETRDAKKVCLALFLQSQNSCT